MQWNDLKALFQTAIDRPAAEWPGLVRDVEARDPALAAQLEALLDAHAAAPSFLESGIAAAFPAADDESPAPPLPSGSIVGPYEIVALIGRGGMGEVYRARDARLGREVAIKLLPAALASNEERRRRMEREARAAGMLSDPRIVTVFDVGSHDGVPYIVTELLEGVTLRQRIDQRDGDGAGPFAPDEAVKLIADVAAGLAVAHARGIVHRDLKPENVFLTRGDQVKILDFGIAKLRAIDGASTILTRPGALLGTIGYMAPEQVQGHEVGPAADVFALGTILYELLTGQRPFLRTTSIEIMTAILHEEPPPLSQLAPDVPAALVAVVTRCLSKPVEARYPNGEVLHAALVAAGARPATHERRWIVTAAVAAALALAILAVSMW